MKKIKTIRAIDSLEDLQHDLTIISQNDKLDGTFYFKGDTHIYGELSGKIFSTNEKHSTEILIGETASLDAEIECDTITIDGFSKGSIIANEKAVITNKGRFIGSIRTPKLIIEPGGFFEGQSSSPLS